MDLKIYKVSINWLPHTIKYREGEQPEGAVEVRAKESPRPASKARTPRNKKP